MTHAFDRTEAHRFRILASYGLTVGGLTLLAWLLVRADWSHLFGSLGAADPAWLALAVLATLLNVMVKALRWQAMVRAGLGPSLSFAECFWMVPVGVAAGALTPARTVDLGKPALLVMRHDVPFGRAVMLALWERFYDLAVLLLAGAVGAVFLGQALPAWRWSAACGILTALLLLALVASPDPLARLAPAVRRLIPRVSDSVEALRSVVASGDPASGSPPGAGVLRGPALAWSGLALVLEFVRIGAVALSLGFDGPWWVAPAIFAIGSLAGLLSLIPGGIGVSEWSQAALWSLLAPGFSQAAAVVMVDRLLSYYGLVLVGAAAMLWTRGSSPAITAGVRPPQADRSQGRIWWVLPAYNEAANIGELIRGIAATPLGRPVAVILVDDGSSDQTVEIASDEATRLGLELIVKQHELNRGLPATLRDGLLAAAEMGAPEDVAICLDADNTHHPRWAQALLAAMDRGADVAICSRYRKGSKTQGVPLHRRVLSDGLNLLLRLFLPVRGVRDYTCGYRAYRVQTLQEAFQRYGDELITSRSFACTAEVLLRLASMGVRVHEVPFVLRYDLKGGSSKMRILATMSEYVRLIARTRIAWNHGERSAVKPQ